MIASWLIPQPIISAWILIVRHALDLATHSILHHCFFIFVCELFKRFVLKVTLSI